jgi:hypothetical protein
VLSGGHDATAFQAKDGAQAVIVQGFFGPHAKRIVQIAKNHRIAYMSTDRSVVVDGGLASILANFPLLICSKSECDKEQGRATHAR